MIDARKKREKKYKNVEHNIFTEKWNEILSILISMFVIWWLRILILSLSAALDGIAGNFYLMSDHWVRVLTLATETKFLLCCSHPYKDGDLPRWHVC